MMNANIAEKDVRADEKSASPVLYEIKGGEKMSEEEVYELAKIVQKMLRRGMAKDILTLANYLKDIEIFTDEEVPYTKGVYVRNDVTLWVTKKAIE